VKTRVLLILSLVMACVLATKAAPPPKLELTLDPGALSIRGATPGGRVLAIGVELTWLEYKSVHRRFQLTGDADANGAVRLEVHYGPSVTSWAVIDLSSGESLTEGFDAAKAKLRDLPPQALRRAPNGKLDKIGLGAEYATVYVVRPGAGAWSATASDGGGDDSLPVPNGEIEIDTSRLTGIDGSATAPSELQKGDLVFALLTHQMTLLKGKVTP
jgi:hypothetical protein